MLYRRLMEYSSSGVYPMHMPGHKLLHICKDLLLVAKDDELGRKLQDLDLPIRKRSPKIRGCV